MTGMEGQVREQVSGRNCPHSDDWDETRAGWSWGGSWEIGSGLTIEVCGGTLRHPYGKMDAAATRTFFFGIVKLLFNG